MKIGLLTLMNVYNYGGILQCLSLCRTLENLGHQVSIFDYTQSPRWRLARRWMYYTGPNIGSILEQKIGERQYDVELYRKFADFKKQHLNLTEPCDSDAALRRISRNYDSLIVGSDQVWNLDWFTPAYFLNFAHDFSGQKVSYAACFGHANQPIEHQKQVGTWLKQFDHLTVRNTMSQTLVKRSCGRDSQIVADPTLLCDVSDLVVNIELPYHQFILLYALSHKRFERVWPILVHLRHRLGMPIVAIKSDVLQPWTMADVDYIVHNPGIEEWLGLFSKSSFVITDSFHGTLYAVKNNIPFLNYIGSDKSRERITYIVERYGMQAGFPTDPTDALEQTLNFESIGNKVEEHVVESLTFLGSL